MVGFLIGFVVGTFAGFLLAALIVMGGDENGR